MGNSNRAGARDARRRRLEAWLLPLLPALLGGVHLTGLLLFLNPRLPFTAASLVRGGVVYGLLLAPLSLATHFAVTRFLHVPARRQLPWSLTLIAVAGALGDWVNASYYSFYLPAGINVQLLKTAKWLSGGALLVFYTALLHTSHRRRYGIRSQLFLALVALGTVYAMFERRTSFRPAPSDPPRLVSTAREGAPRLVLVALPTATLDVVLPLAEQGKLPFFATFLEAGARARLASYGPTRPPALWTTLATGKLPYRHGFEAAVVHELPWLPGGALRLLPITIGFERWGLPAAIRRPVTARDREAAPLWTTLAALGRSTAVFGFPEALGGTPAALAPVAAAPAERELAALGFAPLADALRADRRLLAVARRELTDRNAPEALFLRLDGLERASVAAFGGFAAAQFEGERSGRARRAADALATYYSGLDGELAELWGALAEPRLLVVVSPYGVRAPSGLGRILLDLADRPRLGGSIAGGPDGLWLARGEGVRRGVQVSAASIDDAVPTLLYALGLPVARDLDGRVLAAAFEPALLQRRPLAFVASYEGLIAAAVEVNAP